MLLVVTSCLFATVVVHAFYLQLVDYHHLFLALTVTSVLFHTSCSNNTNKNERLRLLDKGLAHVCFIRILLESPVVIERSMGWLLAFPMAVLCLWFGQSWVNEPTQRDRMHAVLHGVSVLGLHVYMYSLYFHHYHLLPIFTPLEKKG